MRQEYGRTIEVNRFISGKIRVPEKVFFFTYRQRANTKVLLDDH